MEGFDKLSPNGVLLAMTSERIWTAGLLVIGDEILSGRTQDRNVAQVAHLAQPAGDQARRGPGRAGRHGGDRRGGERAPRRATIISSPPAASGRPMTTSPSMRSPRRSASAVVVHPKARAMLEGYYASRGGITEARLQDGAGARGRRADREPHVGRARHPPRQHLHPRRRAAYRDPDARGAVGPDRGRPAVAVADDRLLGRRKARSPICSARPSAPMPAARSAPIPSSRTAGSAPISSSAAPRKARSKPARRTSSGRLEAAGREIVADGI